MTSADSGVDTGNDSNDSYATFETQSTTREGDPGKMFWFARPAPATAKEVREQANGSVDIKKYRCSEVSFPKRRNCGLVCVW